MKHRDTTYLLAYIHDEMDPTEREAFEHEILSKPEIAEEISRLEKLQYAMQSAVAASNESALKPFFEERLMRRLESESASFRERLFEDEFFVGLSSLFRPVAFAGLLLAILLAGYNVSQETYEEGSQTTTEAVLALPPISLATAYEVDY